MRQFGRQYRLDIGSNTSGISIENLRVAFEIKKTIDSKPNPAKISIWNLNESHRRELTSKRFNHVRLYVGYEELRLIFAGDIVKARVLRDDLDFITELECGDGDSDYHGARMSLTLAAGSTDEQAVNAVLGTMTATRKGVINTPTARALPRGKTFVGNSRDILNRVAINNEAEWSIQDGELIVLPTNQVLSGEAVFLAEETGLLGTPEDTDEGLELTCLMNPDIRVGGLVRVESILSLYNGDYKVVSVENAGDVLGGDWVSKLVVRGGNFKKVVKPK